jgi:hypothetical protein
MRTWFTKKKRNSGCINCVWRERQDGVDICNPNSNLTFDSLHGKVEIFDECLRKNKRCTCRDWTSK